MACAYERITFAGDRQTDGVQADHGKIEVGRLASELGLVITVHHLPPGTSTWNKIEHRLFSFIT